MIIEKKPSSKRAPSTQKSQSSTSNHFLIRTSRNRAPSSVKSSGNKSVSLNQKNKDYNYDKPNLPDDGKILLLLNGLESQLSSKQITAKIQLLNINGEYQQYTMALKENIRNPIIARQIIFNVWYHNDMTQTLSDNQSLFGSCLSKHKISMALRARMVDWMIEVFGNYGGQGQSTAHTYFRAVNIMDAYLRKCPKQCTDADLHLIGIVSMFIATKVEDIYQISIKNFVKKVGHNKFSISEIKLKEHELLQALSYGITFPTHLTYLLYIYFKCFNVYDNTQIENIYDSAVYILQMCIHDYDLLQFTPSVLAACSLSYSIKQYFETKFAQCKVNQQDTIKTLKLQTIDSIIKISMVETDIFNTCLKKLEDLVEQFEIRYPDLINLSKFG